MRHISSLVLRRMEAPGKVPTYLQVGTICISSYITNDLKFRMRLDVPIWAIRKLGSVDCVHQLSDFLTRASL